jgi:hypothetical protein
MNNIKSNAQSGRTRSTSSPTHTTANSAPASSSPCDCGCHDHVAEPCGCCKLTCFERPKYFCGQLLSDADLTLQETYFREKNKLYHRTLDGFGVVCGLQMRCDRHCKGHITIGDGYAIDCCGNDLVVCEPRTFDVIGELRKKKWLVERPERRRQPEDRREDDEDCITKQCFYIGICYTEEPVDFATPYATECNPAPGPCQPTRMRECARFEIYDKMPVRPNPLDEIGKRIERCFKMFREGQFSKGLQNVAGDILGILCPETEGGTHDYRDPHSLFQELQAQFLHELRTCPDQYNCDLEREVYQLHPPRRGDSDTGTPPLEAFTRLFELIQKYVFSCVLAQLAFSCPEPSDPYCVLIGSVEIENGCLTRVINYPRWYLWCFANFFEVLIYTLANDAACGKGETPQTQRSTEEPLKPARNGCCPGFEIDVCNFLNLFSADHRAFEEAARAPVDAILATYRALVEGFNFTRLGGIAPAVLRNLDFSKAEGLAKKFNIDFTPLSGQETDKRDVFGALADNTIRFGSEALFCELDANNTVTRVHGMIGAPAFAFGPYTYTMFSDLMDRATKAEERLSKLERDLAALKPPPEARRSG